MRVSDEQIILFKTLFSGRMDVYGTYDPKTRKSWQVKKPVTNRVIRNHLEGRMPYGVYLLHGDRIRAISADFDQDETAPPIMFRQEACKLDLPVHIERSKSKGYHAWIFFSPEGVQASKARWIVLRLLESINLPRTEVFPKQDRLRDATRFGNFINAPLFGRLVPECRSVFVDEHFVPFDDQWAYLSNIARLTEAHLDRIIAAERPKASIPPAASQSQQAVRTMGVRLPPCAQRMLNGGVTVNQRVACFRLACQLRKIGFSFERAVRTLLAWAHRNRPCGGKSVIRPGEVRSQTRSAYATRMYLSCGCEDPAVLPYCDPSCRVRH